MRSALSLPASRVHEMDWWDERVVKLVIPSTSATSTSTSTTSTSGPGASDDKTMEKSTDVNAQVRITCTPSQHTSGRTGLDRWSALWGAYVIEELLPPSSSSPTRSSSPPPTSASAKGKDSCKDSGEGETDGIWTKIGKKVFFAGDTGYKTVHVHKGEKEDDEVAREVCPAFKEVGERFGGVDGAMLPIGWVFSLSLRFLSLSQSVVC